MLVYSKNIKEITMSLRMNVNVMPPIASMGATE